MGNRMRLAVVILSLFCAAGAIDLICDFSEELLNEENVRICKPVNLVITKPNQNITSVNGRIGRQLDVIELVISTQTLNYFPRNIDAFFPNLVRIRIYESQLKMIEQADLKPFPKLERFEAVKNKFTRIYSNLFYFNPELRWIQLWDNELGFIGSDILNSLKKLEILNLLGNQCCSFSAIGGEEITKAKDIIYAYCNNYDPSRISDQLKKEKANKDWILHYKKFTQNNLVETSKLFTSVLEGRETSAARYRPFKFELTCWYNGTECKVDKASEADTDDIPADSVVDILFIDKKPMIFIPSNIPRHFPDLTQLWIENSAIIMIDANDFANLTWLEHLYFDDNLIQNVPTEVFINSPNLAIIHMKRNLIDTLEPRAFAGLSNLGLLALSGNLLTTIHSDAFEGLKNLKKLFLSNNRLKFIDPKLLRISKFLNTIDLTSNNCTSVAFPRNRLSEIESEIIAACAFPITISCIISQNENECNAKGLSTISPKTEISAINGRTENVTSILIADQSMKYFPKVLGSFFANLTELTVDNSGLLTIEEQNFNGMSSLKELRILNNNLTSISGSSFDALEQLELLDLSFNFIEALPAHIFANLVTLRSLILSNNNLKQLSASSFFVGQPLNEIVMFKADSNALQRIEVGLIKYVRSATIIDLTGNICIDMKLEKQNTTGVVFADLATQIILNCTY